VAIGGHRPEAEGEAAGAEEADERRHQGENRPRPQ
jgi:hypothetical protein